MFSAIAVNCDFILNDFKDNFNACSHCEPRIIWTHRSNCEWLNDWILMSSVAANLSNLSSPGTITVTLAMYQEMLLLTDVTKGHFCDCSHCQSQSLVTSGWMALRIIFVISVADPQLTWQELCMLSEWMIVKLILASFFQFWNLTQAYRSESWLIMHLSHWRKRCCLKCCVQTNLSTLNTSNLSLQGAGGPRIIIKFGGSQLWVGFVDGTVPFY